MAANYLDMEDLMDCACLAVAKYIRGRSLREIRQRFSLFDDLTMVEKRLLARENQFIDFKASLDADADDDWECVWLTSITFKAIFKTEHYRYLSTTANNKNIKNINHNFWI